MKRRLSLFLAGMVCLPACSTAWAAPQSLLQIGPAGDYLLKSLLILLVLLAVMAGVLKLLRRTGHLKKVVGSRIRIVEGVSLGGHDRAVLISVDDQELLLGVSQGRISALMQLPGNLDLAPAKVETANLHNNENPPTSTFAELMKPGAQ